MYGSREQHKGVEMLNPSTLKNGHEQHETFMFASINKSRLSVQYDYRHTDGELFSCVKPTLEKCIEARDSWLKQKGVNA